MEIMKEEDKVNFEIKCRDLISKISDVLAGLLTRKDVSEWAVNIFNDDNIRLSDPIIIKYLQILGGIDLPAPDREYLYMNEDLEEWIIELRKYL